MKKVFVLIALFVLPLVAYLFFASGVDQFGRLPILTPKVLDVSVVDDTKTMKGKITILGFFGEDLAQKKGNAFNLNQKIYKRFSAFKDFQFIMVIPEGNEEELKQLKKELQTISEIDKWNFAIGKKDDIQLFFDGLKTNFELEKDYATPYVFIIDKELNLRGRMDDKEEGIKYGFDTTSVADLNNKMEDDVKVILAEYRLALKKNYADERK